MKHFMSNMIKLHFLLGEAMSMEPENYQQKLFLEKIVLDICKALIKRWIFDAPTKKTRLRYLVIYLSQLIRINLIAFALFAY